MCSRGSSGRFASRTEDVRTVERIMLTPGAARTQCYELNAAHVLCLERLVSRV